MFLIHLAFKLEVVGVLGLFKTFKNHFSKIFPLGAQNIHRPKFNFRLLDGSAFKGSFELKVCKERRGYMFVYLWLPGF